MKIPIANVYYLLCYAWRHMEESDVVDVSTLEELDQVHDLLGHVLAAGTFQLVRRGLDRGYVEIRDDLAGIRGKLDMGEMAKRAMRARGRAACVFEELSYDVPHNQILRSTLATLLRLPQLGRRVRSEVRGAFQRLEGIKVIRVDRQAFRRVQLDRNRRRYRLLLAICELVHDSLLVDRKTGEMVFRDLREDYPRMAALFEEFVQEFYRREQRRYRVNRGGRRVRWMDAQGATESDHALIPQMQADVLLDAPDRRIILDAKFYGEALSDRWGAPKLRSGNLYQLLAYLRNREATEPGGARHEGVLLYPVVGRPVAADIRLEGFRIQARGIDLTQHWRRIHEDMLSVVDT